jgi:hypothetical protein
MIENTRDIRSQMIDEFFLETNNASKDYSQEVRTRKWTRIQSLFLTG